MHNFGLVKIFFIVGGVFFFHFMLRANYYRLERGGLFWMHPCVDYHRLIRSNKLRDIVISVVFVNVNIILT